MTEQQTPTPIDPADIRPGDVVRVVEECTIEERDDYMIRGGGYSFSAGDVPGRTWLLVSRPDPDAEVIEALARRMHDDSACKDRFGSCVSTTATYRSEAARYVAYIREQGFDVVKRADQ